MHSEAMPHAGGLSYDEFERIAPGARNALLAMGKAVDESGLEKSLTELVKLRVSQVNGCAFCIQLHLNVARRLDVAAPKLDLIAAWRDAGVYTPRELAALGWADAVTKLGEGEARGPLRAALDPHFSEDEIVHLTVAIANINAWNRIAATLHFPPPIPRSA
ncbi:carboxymuconolactone decarboxylase family protein [Rhizobium sp. C1]|uniref:carboxymuconolactone decarboxylase family protein n=1 Tax=Rhizobium sp. C1 TaxID=1349799 RepID=UPI001E53FBE4|nr:carboxymuconolactone decarboxylase family protein [Rhizobium sp. C1]MCD2176504.1 carboxymuconolactone decarboxylase family protein [Rhizobium sp. C1]